ncbi:MAG TPA: PEPxxWA-CTERM sorting domain-containing protein [Caulobacteraceae bacterium]|jgi:hypothetical protein|nr:PEPxxWA-CTERM sorting domain-containing protein [Caulobacteraceae bacterium]
MALKKLLISAAFGFGMIAAASAQASTVFVSAKDDIFLAGMTTVPAFPAAQTQTAVPGNGAGQLPVGVAVHGGEVLDLVATGLADCGVGCNPAGSGPDGDPEFGTGSIAGYGNVGAYTGTNNEGFQLLGVYNAGSTPWTPFVIGSGGTFVVPTGATRLYLGLPDGFSFAGLPGTYNDNTGGFSVSGVPEPATWAMMLMGAGIMGAAMRSTRRKARAAIA